MTGTWESRSENRINHRDASSVRQGLGYEAGSTDARDRWPF